jgi:trimeric autotransporter adhesin
MFLVQFVFSNSALAAPQRTTYQAKIIKPDGNPLEAPSVNFRFTVMDPAGTCVLYVENFASVNMANSGGLIALPLGSGTKSFPTSGTISFSDVFDNTSIARSCQPTGGPATYTPVATDVRKIVMQFQDANGWQTLPAMAINSVPYANYADKATNAMQLNGKADTAFVEKATLPVCITGEALFFDGSTFTCVPNVGGSGSGTVTNVASSNGYLSISSSTTTPLLTLNVGTASNTVAAGNDSRITGAAQKSANLSDLTSSATARSNLGLGALATQNSIVASDVTSALGYVPAASGSITAITSFNGSTSATQIFATGITGTVFSISSVNGVHTFNLPFAASGGVVGGVLSNADYVAFTNKMSATSSAVISALGYVPAASGATATDATALKIANNLSDLASSATARTNLGLGALATLDFIDLNSALASGTLAVSKLADSGVIAGTYTKVTVDAKGRVTSGTSLSASDVNTALGYTAANSATVATVQSDISAVSAVASSALSAANSKLHQVQQQFSKY